METHEALFCQSMANKFIFTFLYFIPLLSCPMPIQIHYFPIRNITIFTALFRVRATLTRHDWLCYDISTGRMSARFSKGYQKGKPDTGM